VLTPRAVAKSATDRCVRSRFKNVRSVRWTKTSVDFIHGSSNPDPMAKTKKPAYDPQWAKTKTVCRLNIEDIRMAKELGLSPQSLRKNRPSPSQPWKQPVKEWIHELYEKRFGRKISALGVADELNEPNQL
jgi:hypothetical protein